MPLWMRQILREWAEKVPSDLTPLLGIAAAVIILGLIYFVFDRLTWRPNSSWRVKIVNLFAWAIVLLVMFFILISVLIEHGPDALEQNTKPEKDEVGSSMQEPNDCPAQQKVPSFMSVRMETSQLPSPNPAHLPVATVPPSVLTETNELLATLYSPPTASDAPIAPASATTTPSPP